MLSDELVLNLQGIDLLDKFGQFTHAGDALQMHRTAHLAQHTREMKVYHVQVASENLVGRIVELQDTSQAFNHKHTAHDIFFLSKGIDFVHGRCGKLHARLLELEIGRTPAIQQREHRAQT